MELKELKLRSASDVRNEVLNKRLASKVDRDYKILQGVIQKIEEKKHVGVVTMLTLPASVVIVLKDKGYKVTFNHALASGDCDTHTISWI